MIEFRISAPGIITLAGEYAEIYGKNIVISTLNERTTLQFAELIHNLRICKIEFPDVNLTLNLTSELVENFLSSYNIIGMNRERLFKYVQYFITANGLWSTHEQRVSLQMFFFLFFYIGHREQLELRPFRVHIKTEIPLQANLGSSTSFAVCLAACFLHWSRRQMQGDHNGFNSNELTEITEAAMYCKKAVQNLKCFMTMEVCARGHRVRRYRAFNPENNRRDVIMTELNMLLIDSTCRPNKNQTIEHVARMRYLHPEYTNNILNTIDELSIHITGALQNFFINRLLNIFNSQVRYFNLIERNIEENQRALSKLHLSDSVINTIVEIANAYGYGSVAKFTGVGHKKFIYILLRPEISEQMINNLPVRIEAEGFPIKVTTVSCRGVIIEN